MAPRVPIDPSMFLRPNLSIGYASLFPTTQPDGMPPPDPGQMPQPPMSQGPQFGEPERPMLQVPYQPQQGTLPAPSREPGMFKRMLMNFTYGMGQSMAHALGMPTDDEIAQRKLATQLAQTREAREGRMTDATIANMMQLRQESEERMRNEREDRAALRDIQSKPKPVTSDYELAVRLAGPNATPDQIVSALKQVRQTAVPKQDTTHTDYEDFRQGFDDTPQGHAQAARMWQKMKMAEKAAGKDTTMQELRRQDMSYRYHTSAIDKLAGPLDQQAQRIGRLQDTLRQGSPQADALVAPELLTALAGGQGSGLRMNEAEISRIIGGRSNWEALKAAANKWSLDPASANSITKDQRSQIHKLVQAVADKVQRQQDAINSARDDLAQTNDPADHKRIYTKLRRSMGNIIQLDRDAPAPGGIFVPSGTARKVTPH